MSNRLAGTIELKIAGVTRDAVGSFTYNLGREKKDGLVGHDKVHGYKALPQVPFIEGEIRDRSNLDVDGLLTSSDITILLTLANGKVIMLENAWYAGEGNIETEEANIQVRFEGLSADEVTS